MRYRVLLSDPLGPEGLARLHEQPDLEIEAQAGSRARRAAAASSATSTRSSSAAAPR